MLRINNRSHGAELVSSSLSLWLHEQAQLGEVQANSQRYVDAVKLLLAVGGRVDNTHGDQR